MQYHGLDDRIKATYREAIREGGGIRDEYMEELGEEDGNISDDDLIKEEEGPWFSMRMMKEEKREAWWPWRLSVIIKLPGRNIGYKFLLNKQQAMWRIPHKFDLIDLSNEFFFM